MKLRSGMIAAGVTVMLAAPMVFAQGMGMGMGGGLSFADTDKDEDGSLSKEELSAAVPENMLDTLFDRWDADKDGMISEDEFNNRNAAGGDDAAGGMGGGMGMGG